MVNGQRYGLDELSLDESAPLIYLKNEGVILEFSSSRARRFKKLEENVFFL